MEKKENSKFKSISVHEKVKLTTWMLNNKELCEKSTAEQIRKSFYDETQIDLSLSTVNSYRNEICPRVIKRIPGGKLNGGKMMQMIKQLEERVIKLEELLK